MIIIKAINKANIIGLAEFFKKPVADFWGLMESGSFHFTGYLAYIDREFCGAAWGVIPKEKPNFFSLDSFFILPEHTNKGIGTLLFKQLLADCKTRGVKKLCHRHTQGWSNRYSMGAVDSMLANFNKEYFTQNKTLADTYIFQSERLKELDKYSWYQPDGIPSIFEVKLWSKCEEDRKDEIKNKEQEYKRNDMGYLSPFFAGVYDDKTSIALFHREHGTCAGWIITSKLNDNSIYVKSYYIFNHYRNLFLGPWLGSYFMHYLCPQYKKLVFKSIRSSRSVSAVFRKYLEPLASNHQVECLVEIDFQP